MTKASLENYDIESCPSESLKTPKRKDLSKHHVTVENIRKRAKSYNRKLEKRMMAKHKRRSRPPTEYRPGDIVLLRLRSKKGRIAPKRRHVLKGRVIARNLKTSMYKVSYTNLNSNQKLEKWISVEDMTSVTSQEEKAKRKEQEQKRQKRLHRKKFRIVLTRKDTLELFGERALIAFDPPKDGNCQFSALCFFLRSIGIERSPETLRREIVKYLRENPNDSEGFPLELFAGQGWADYLAEMNKEGTYGDHITLQAASNIFNVQITVHSSLSVVTNTVIQPFTGAGVAHFNLGHFAEGQGEHYVCLEVEENDDENCPNEIQEHQEVCNEEDKVGENNDQRENKTSGKTNREDQTATEDACDGIYENQNDNNNHQSRRKGNCSFNHLPDEIIAMVFETAL